MARLGFLLVQQRLQCLHNANCLQGGLRASVEKHVARLPLMTGCLLPAVLQHCVLHVRLYDPFIARAFITLSHWGGGCREGICFGSMLAGLKPCQCAETVLAGKSIPTGRTDNLLSPLSFCALHTQHSHRNTFKEQEP